MHCQCTSISPGTLAVSMREQNPQLQREFPQMKQCFSSNFPKVSKQGRKVADSQVVVLSRVVPKRAIAKQGFQASQGLEGRISK